jgi:hypothetical protein
MGGMGMGGMGMGMGMGGQDAMMAQVPTLPLRCCFVPQSTFWC